MHVEIDEGIRSVLILEDEMIVAMMMEDLVREMGVRDIHLCAGAAEALKVLEAKPIDCAVLDLRVRDGSSVDVADALAERGTPFFFSSGSDATALAERHSDRPMLGKPFTDDDFKLIVLDTWTLGRPRRSTNGAGAAERAET